MNLLQLEYLNGTPIFVSPNENAVFGRIHGNVFDRDRKVFFFPAYPPFGQLVLADLKKVVPDLVFAPDARAHADYLTQVPELVQNRILPDGFSFVTKPFDHQIDGLAHLFHHPRFALFWDPGTGKSKVVVDLKRLHPDKRMLILTPPVTVQNWAREIEIHGSKDIKVATIEGTPDRKRKIIAGYKEYDVLVCSYGTARMMGLPRLQKETLKYILQAKKAGAHLSDSGLKELVKAVRQVSDTERQAAYVLAWAWGMPIAQVKRWAEAESELTPQWLEDVDYQIIVADESHNMMDASSQQTKTALALSRKAGRRYLMSGTPTLGDPRHLYPQMKFLSPAIFPEDVLKFSDLFLVRSPWNKRIVTGFKNLNILNTRVQRVAIRKRKDECLDLPPRQIIDVPFTLSGEAQRLYNTLVNNLGADLNSFFTNASDMEIQNAAVLLNKLTQVTSGFIIDSNKKTDICNNCPHLAKCVVEGINPYTPKCAVTQVAPPTLVHRLKENPKLEALEGLLDTILLEPSNKVIIWGVHHEELRIIAEMLERRKLDFVQMHGNASGKVQDKIDRFNNHPDCRVYLGQIATGIGITLNAATYTIYSSVDWSLGTYLQSIDRNYRAGQTKKVTVYRLLGEGTVDQYKATTLDLKKDISGTLTNKLACATCAKRFECLRAGIELFDDGCIYKRNVKRTVARAEVI